MRKLPPPPLAHSYWVERGRLLAGEHPSSGSEAARARRVQLLLAAGVRAIIDLTQEGEMPEYRHLLHTVSAYAVADPLHSNAVEVVTAATGRNFPFGHAGQVLLSFRELGAVGVLDTGRAALVWAVRGPWVGQHDPDLLPNGDILLFDNYGNYETPAGRSRVLEFDPKTMKTVWQYAGSAESRGLQVIIAAAGGAAHLAGVTAAKTVLPVPTSTKRSVPSPPSR